MIRKGDIVRMQLPCGWGQMVCGKVIKVEKGMATVMDWLGECATNKVTACKKIKKTNHNMRIYQSI